MVKLIDNLQVSADPITLLELPDGVSVYGNKGNFNGELKILQFTNCAIASTSANPISLSKCSVNDCSRPELPFQGTCYLEDATHSYHWIRTDSMKTGYFAKRNKSTGSFVASRMPYHIVSLSQGDGFFGYHPANGNSFILGDDEANLFVLACIVTSPTTTAWRALTGKIPAVLRGIVYETASHVGYMSASTAIATLYVINKVTGLLEGTKTYNLTPTATASLSQVASFTLPDGKAQMIGFYPSAVDSKLAVLAVTLDDLNNPLPTTTFEHSPTITGGGLDPVGAGASSVYAHQADGKVYLTYVGYSTTAVGAKTAIEVRLYEYNPSTFAVTYIKTLAVGDNVFASLSAKEDNSVIALRCASSVRTIHFSVTNGVPDLRVGTTLLEVPTSIGVDRFHNIYAVSANGVFQVNPNEFKVVIKASGGSNYYEYDGAQQVFDTLVSVRDSTDSQVVKSVDLTLEGSAVFANGLQKLTISSSASVDVTVPVTITGTGDWTITGSKVR